MFEDMLAANDRYVSQFRFAGLAPRAARGLAIVTCMDSRIEPLAMLGIEPGDAKIMRNAGGRVTDDVLRSLALATSLLGVRGIAVMHHTLCAMVTTDEQLATAVAEATGADTSGIDFLAMDDPDTALKADVDAVLAHPAMRPGTSVTGWRYDVDTGAVTEIVPPRTH